MIQKFTPVVCFWFPDYGYWWQNWRPGFGFTCGLSEWRKSVYSPFLQWSFWGLACL